MASMQIPEESQQFPSFDEARSKFTGERGGTGNRAAAGTTVLAPPQPEISSQWTRPGSDRVALLINIHLLRERDVANDPAEKDYITSLLFDADWSYRFGTRRFTRVLRAVLSRDEIDAVATSQVSTSVLLTEVMATIADEEAIEAGGTAPPRLTPPRPTITTDEPMYVSTHP